MDWRTVRRRPGIHPVHPMHTKLGHHYSSSSFGAFGGPSGEISQIHDIGQWENDVDKRFTR